MVIQNNEILNDVLHTSPVNAKFTHCSSSNLNAKSAHCSSSDLNAERCVASYSTRSFGAPPANSFNFDVNPVGNSTGTGSDNEVGLSNKTSPPVTNEMVQSAASKNTLQKSILNYEPNLNNSVRGFVAKLV